MPDDVDTWLEELGLGEYAAMLVDNAIDVDVLPDLTEADLEKIGVKLGHRKKLLKAITTLKHEKSVALIEPRLAGHISENPMLNGEVIRLDDTIRMQP